MKKYLLSILMAAAALIGVQAQQMTPLPLKAEVKSGQLPNGLSYYILHNSEPKERANFYIAQKVGSTLEEPSQLGLAHFLEHMAFNGTTHYPGKAMLNYLQSKGIRFGADINAYTAFDETVYNINNVPTTDRPLMDSVLLVLRDWSDGIALEESEIDAERGVINEEWRSRNDAQTRMFTSILPQIYNEYQYQQMPIGSMDVVLNFKPETLRAYYKKWYRPDQQGIVIVGDFDAEEMEKKVLALFSDVVMPENAAERIYPTVSDNEEPIFATFTDKEAQFPSIRVSFKYEKTPFEFRNTVEAYLQDNIMENIISTIINERLNEYQKDPACPYAYAGFGFGDYYVSKTKGAVTIFVVPKDNIEAAYNSAIEVVARACKAGFNDTELTRAREAMVSSYEKMYNERNTTSNSAYADELIRHFVDNEPAPGIEAELNIVQNILPMLPVQAYNQVAESLLTPTNQVIVVTLPESDQYVMPAKETLVADLEKAINAQYDAKVEEMITEPLIAKMPKAGKVVSEKYNDLYGATELKLSNGAKVIVKTTDFKGDEIIMNAFREGGKRCYAPNEGPNVQMAGDVVDFSNIGNFDPVKLQKYLAGKHVSLGFSIDNYTDAITGASNVKDLPTLMELIYATATSLNPNEDVFNAQMQQFRTLIANQDKMPNKVFSDAITKTCYGNNPLLNNPNLAMLEAVEYPVALKMAKNAMANAADYTFVFSGNVDVETIKPLLEQYIASLPSKKKASKIKTVTELNRVTGRVNNDFTYAEQTPSVRVFTVIGDNNVEFNTRNAILTSMVGDVLDMIYIETLREEEGGTYGASVGSTLNPNNGYWGLQYIFQTSVDKKDNMLLRAEQELENLLANGAKADHFNKVKEADIKQFEIQQRTNNYWVNKIVSAERGFNTISDYEQILRSLTLEDLNNFMKNLYNGKNRIQVIMDGVAE